MLVLSRGALASPAAQVLEHVRRGGVAMREDLVDSTELSPATVSRAIAALISARLLRPRPEMGRIGTAGRPSVPVQLEARCHAVVGIHVGIARTVTALTDIGGRLLETVESPRPARQRDLWQHLVAQISALHTTGRRVMSVGLVGAWTDLGVDGDELGRWLSAALGLEVTTADHIAAAAAAEHAVGARGADGPTVYVYARDAVGFAVAEETAVGTVVTRASRLTHFPTGSQVTCTCRAVGCLETTVGDRAIAVRAQAEGVVDVPDVAALHEAARAGSRPARTLLRERAVVLGRAAAAVRDMVGNDRVVLIGQAFTASPHVRDAVLEGFEQATTLPPVDVTFGHHGHNLQAAAASAVALVPFTDDPLALHATARADDGPCQPGRFRSA